MPTKRSNSPSQPIPPPRKRARRSVSPSESTQVTALAPEYRLPLLDGDVYYVPQFVDHDKAQRWYEALLGIEGWYQPTLKMYGKEITQSRKIAAYATDPSITVKYSGATVQMQYTYPPLLREIQDLVEDKLGVNFNHVMINLYQTGKVYIGNHRDNKENRVIASLSLGAPRTFHMTHSPLARSATSTTSVDSAQLKSKRWVLENGSLVVQQGRTQEFWKHEIPKEGKVKEGRISLTFRQLVW